MDVIKFLTQVGGGGQDAARGVRNLLEVMSENGRLGQLDGVVSALLKSPFNQMCYAINKAEGISYKKKDSIITKATESNEHCKETLKKFGILTICGEVARIIIEGAKGAGDKDKYGDY